jgi:hypothetical protein
MSEYKKNIGKLIDKMADFWISPVEGFLYKNRAQ